MKHLTEADIEKFVIKLLKVKGIYIYTRLLLIVIFQSVAPTKKSFLLLDLSDH